MSTELDLYLARSGPYTLAFVSGQIASVATYPLLDQKVEGRPGLLGLHEGLRVVHPGWLWGEVTMSQAPRFMLVLRSGTHALAVDSYRLERLPVQPAPPVFSGRGMVYGVVATPDGLTPVLDLARMPLA